MVAKTYEHVTAGTSLADVVGHPALADFGPFLAPARGRSLDGMTLADVGGLLIYHSHVDPGTSVEVVNALIRAVGEGRTVPTTRLPAHHDRRPWLTDVFDGA